MKGLTWIVRLEWRNQLWGQKISFYTSAYMGHVNNMSRGLEITLLGGVESMVMHSIQTASLDTCWQILYQVNAKQVSWYHYVPETTQS